MTAFGKCLEVPRSMSSGSDTPFLQSFPSWFQASMADFRDKTVEDDSQSDDHLPVRRFLDPVHDYGIWLGPL